jgi:hypothetical protein
MYMCCNVQWGEEGEGSSVQNGNNGTKSIPESDHNTTAGESTLKFFQNLVLEAIIASEYIYRVFVSTCLDFLVFKYTYV